MFVVCCLLFVDCRLVTVVACRCMLLCLFVGCWSLLFVEYLIVCGGVLFVVRNSLFVVCCLLFGVIC